jgi:8-oxo-dGTP diphosphatase
VETALVHRSAYDDWTLPKGKLLPGEHPLAGACREVVEETGFSPVAGPRLPSLEYEVLVKGQLAPKVVDYWAMRAVGGEFSPNPEVDALRWCQLDRAAALLTYDHDRMILRAFSELPVETTTVVLVRHAKAGDRSRWAGEDAERPLDGKGRTQAEQLAEWLPWYGIGQLISADRVRCVQTVSPLAGRLGLPMQITEHWNERCHATAPARAASLVRELAATGVNAVVCSQGGVIPDTVALLGFSEGLRIGPPLARKGSAWVLSFAGSRLVDADYLVPK